MTIMTDTSGFQAPNIPSDDVFQTTSGPILTETYWGFTVRNTAEVPTWLVLCQMVAFLFGAAFVAAAVGLWAVPSAIIQLDTWTLRVGLSAFFGALGYLMVSYANQGRTVEFQFDQNLGEIREVMPNRSGTSRLVAQYGFDVFSEISIDRCGTDKVALVLKQEGSGQTLLIAQGTEPQIGALYARLDRDLLRASSGRRHLAVRPRFG